MYLYTLNVVSPVSLVCYFVCDFFPFILDIKFVGRTSRGHTGGRSHRISHPPSFCGTSLNFSREKDSAFPFPRRPCKSGIFSFSFFSEKNTDCRDRTHVPTCQKVTWIPLSYRGDRSTALLIVVVVVVVVVIPYAVCVGTYLSIHRKDAPAGVTTVERPHILPTAVHALDFLSREGSGPPYPSSTLRSNFVYPRQISRSPRAGHCMS